MKTGKRLYLHSQVRRRVRGDLIEVSKWMKGFNKGNVNEVLVIKKPVRTCSNGFKFDKSYSAETSGKICLLMEWKTSETSLAVIL